MLASSHRRAVAIAEDMTKDLRASETSLSEAQRMAHLGNWSLDTATWNMTWSAETYRIFGLTPRSAPVSYMEFLEYIYKEDRRILGDAIRHAVESGKGLEMEHRIVLNYGTVRWAQTIVKSMSDERQALVPGTIMDITEQKHAREKLRESALQLQALSRRLVDIQELERRQFSRELHDRVGQNLTALGINLDILKSGLAADGNAALRSRLDDSATLLEATTSSIENVMSELRPPMLDDYGLLPALQWYESEFSRRTSIKVTVKGCEPSERLSPEAEIALFRIAQEALNNIVKHAHARQVEIRLDCPEGAECAMIIADDGMGFDSAAVASPRRRASLGMVTMRERAEAIGGRFEVVTAPGQGTRIIVKVPRK